MSDPVLVLAGAASAEAPASPALALTPIGYVHTSVGSKAEASRQPRSGRAAAGRIELLAGRNFEHALHDLDDWDYIWVLFWFDRNSSWRPKVLPPRSRTGRKGVFATRSPHRPNPLGLSAVRLLCIDGLTLHVRDLDMLDGTPVLDLKPYVPYTDAIAGAGSGWLDRDGRASEPDPIAAYAVEWSTVAAEQALWVEQRAGLSLRERATATLKLGPEPHPYRRIRREPSGFTLAVKEWRLRFAVAGRVVTVASVASGYRASQLERAGATTELAVHREFRERWPGGTS